MTKAAAPGTAASARLDGINYLLSLNVLLALCSNRDNPARAWAGETDARRLRLSVVTVALAQSAVNAVSPALQGERMRSRLAALLAEIRADAGDALPFAAGAAAAWQSFLHEPTLDGMLQVDRQFYATALSEGLCVVEYDHALSDALLPLGIRVHSLGAQTLSAA